MAFVKLVVLLSLLGLLIGCGGSGGSTSTILGTGRQVVGVAGGTINVPTSSGHESLTIAPGSLSADAAITVQVQTGSATLPADDLAKASNLVTITLDPTMLTGKADLVLSGQYTGDVDSTDLSSFVVVDKPETGEATILDALPPTPLITGDSASHTFSAHIALEFSGNPSSKRGSGMVPSPLAGIRTFFLAQHAMREAERNPKIRPFRFRTAFINSLHGVGTEIVRLADSRGPSAAISGDCWEPLDGSSHVDGTSKRVAILVHGINNRINNLSALAYYLTTLRDGENPYYDEVWGIDHDWEGSIAPQGDQLAEFINSKLGGATKADIFAHSQGTLVARYAIEVSGGNAKAHVQRAFLFAPMNNGLPIRVENVYRNIIAPLHFGYVGIKEMLRDPGEPYRRFWYLLDRLVDSDGQGNVTYKIFTGGDPDSYFAGALDAIYINTDHDGIVPWTSSKYIPAPHSNAWVELPGPGPSDRFTLAHDKVVGRFAGEALTTLNLNSPVNNTLAIDECLTTAILEGQTSGSPYTAVDLGTLGGGGITATALNNHGWVTGSATALDGSSHAFLWHDNQMTDLVFFGYSGSPPLSAQGTSINDLGTVAGAAHTPYTGGEPFSWSAGTSRPLGLLLPVGYYGFNPASINANGDIVGTFLFSFSGVARSYAGAILSDGFHDFTSETTQNANVSSSFTAINDQGQMVGYSIYDGFPVAFFFKPGQPVQAVYTGNGWSNATALSSNGYVTGSFGSRGPSIDPHAFRWKAGSFTELPLLDAAHSSSCVGQGVDDAGTVVGTSTDDSGHRVACLWKVGQEPRDLNSLVSLPGVTLTGAVAINVNGQILCQGMVGTAYHGFLLTPVDR